MLCKPDFCINFSSSQFMNLHARVEYANLRKVILHLQIEQDFIYPVVRMERKSLYKYKRYKKNNLFCLSN